MTDEFDLKKANVPQAELDVPAAAASRLQQLCQLHQIPMPQAVRQFLGL